MSLRRAAIGGVFISCIVGGLLSGRQADNALAQARNNYFDQMENIRKYDPETVRKINRGELSWDVVVGSEPRKEGLNFGYATAMFGLITGLLYKVARSENLD